MGFYSVYSFFRITGIQYQLDYQLSTNKQLIAGVDYEVRDVERGYRGRTELQSTPLVLAISEPRVSTNDHNGSIFAQYQFDSESFEDTQFTLGARYDENRVYGSTFNPRIGVVVLPTEELTIKASLASAYRAPIASIFLPKPL